MSFKTIILLMLIMSIGIASADVSTNDRIVTNSTGLHIVPAGTEYSGTDTALYTNLSAEYHNAIAEDDQIINAVNATEAQQNWALKRLAEHDKLELRFLAGVYKMLTRILDLL